MKFLKKLEFQNSCKELIGDEINLKITVKKVINNGIANCYNTKNSVNVKSIKEIIKLINKICNKYEYPYLKNNNNTLFVSYHDECENGSYKLFCNNEIWEDLIDWIVINFNYENSKEFLLEAKDEYEEAKNEYILAKNDLFNNNDE